MVSSRRFQLPLLLLLCSCWQIAGEVMGTEFIDTLPNPINTFTVATATYLSSLCAISYCPLTNIQNWKCSQCDKNLRAPTVFRQGSQQFVSYVTDNNVDTIFVVFKGTDPLSWDQWATDLDVACVDYPLCKGCKVHSGFFNAMNTQFLKLQNAVDAARARLSSPTLVVVGHSLGGAIANLFAVQMVQRQQKPFVYTFGGPRVGNKAWSDYYNGLLRSGVIQTSFRINNDRDLVPHLPPNFASFVHVGVLVYCVKDTKCTVMENVENEKGFLHTSVLDHAHYLGINYFDYISLGSQTFCSK